MKFIESGDHPFVNDVPNRWCSEPENKARIGRCDIRVRDPLRRSSTAENSCDNFSGANTAKQIVSLVEVACRVVPAESPLLKNSFTAAEARRLFGAVMVITGNGIYVTS